MKIKNLPIAVSGVLAVFGLALNPSFAAESPPVLMVIANQDFHYLEYADTRASLEEQGLEVVVAAATTDVATPHARNPRWTVRPDLALTDVVSDQYSAVVFGGGWGMAQYQYGFEGTYHNAAYRLDRIVIDTANRLINEFSRQGKYLAAIGHGVTVLAYAQVDGASPIAGRKVSAWAGGGPGFDLDGDRFADATVATRWHVEKNGGSMPLSAAAGDPLTVEDDVYIDGQIITAENYDSAYLLGQVIASLVYK